MLEAVQPGRLLRREVLRRRLSRQLDEPLDNLVGVRAALRAHGLAPGSEVGDDSRRARRRGSRWPRPFARLAPAAASSSRATRRAPATPRRAPAPRDSGARTPSGRRCPGDRGCDRGARSPRESRGRSRRPAASGVSPKRSHRRALLPAQLVPDRVGRDRDHEGLERLGLAQGVHALEERQKHFLDGIVDLVLGPERALEHPVHHRREPLPGQLAARAGRPRGGSPRGRRRRGPHARRRGTEALVPRARPVGALPSSARSRNRPQEKVTP